MACMTDAPTGGQKVWTVLEGQSLRDDWERPRGRGVTSHKAGCLSTHSNGPPTSALTPSYSMRFTLGELSMPE